MNWIFRTTFFANRSKITELTVPTFQTGGFALSLGTFQIEQDSSPTQIFGFVGVDGNGNPVAGKVGDANPDFQMSFSSDVDFHRFTLGLLFDWKQGGDIINLTEFLYDAGQNSKDYTDPGGGARAHHAVRRGVHRALRPERHVREAARGQPVLQPAGAVDVSVSSGAASGTARLSLTGRNLLRFTPYRGLDPEVSNFGQPGDRAEHRRGSVPAESQLLLLDRPGVLTMTTITKLSALALAARRHSAAGACSYDIANPNTPDVIGENPNRSEVCGDGQRHPDRHPRGRGRLGPRRRHLRPRGVPVRRLRPAIRRRADAGAARPGKPRLRRRPLGGGVRRHPDRERPAGGDRHGDARSRPKSRARSSGFAHTLQAYNFLIVLDSHTAGLDPDRRGHRRDSAARAVRHQRRRLRARHRAARQAVAELDAGGAAFPFSLPPGFAGFNTPATFLQFNRALRARVAVYRGDFTGALTFLAAIVHRPRRRRSTVACTWISAPAPATSPIRWRSIPQTGENFGHPSLETQAQLQPGGALGPALPGQAGDPSAAVGWDDDTDRPADQLGSRLDPVSQPQHADPADQERGADPAPRRGNIGLSNLG